MVVQILWIIFIILVSDAATRPIVPLSSSNSNMEYNVEKYVQKVKSEDMRDISMQLFQIFYWERFFIMFSLIGLLFMIIILYYDHFRKYIRSLCPTLANWFDDILEVDSSLKPYILHQADNSYYVLELCV